MRSDVALEWPMPSYYSPGALLPETDAAPVLLHCPDGDAPYTPPIPLYLALCFYHRHHPRLVADGRRRPLPAAPARRGLTHPGPAPHAQRYGCEHGSS